MGKESMVRKKTFQINRNPSVQSQIIRPVTIIMVIVFVIFAAIGIFLFQDNIRRTLAQDNQKALLERGVAINDIIKDAILDAQGITTRASALNFARGVENGVLTPTATLSVSQTQLTRDFLEILNNHLDIYNGIRFVTRQGSIWTEVTNQNGILSNNSLVRQGDLENDFSFQNTLKNGTVTLSPIKFGKDSLGAPQVILQIFAPVVDSDANGKTIGVIELTTSAATILDVVNGAADISDQRWILVNNQGYYLADSAAERLQSGKLAENTYSLVADSEPDLAKLISGSPAEIDLSALGSSVMSARAITPGNAPDMPWQLIVIQQSGLAGSGLYTGTIALALLALAGCLLTIWFINTILGNRLKPLSSARMMASQLAASQGDATMASSGNEDEIIQLNNAFKRISARLHELTEGMEQQAQSYSRNLDMAARISQETASLSEADDLLARITELICNEFDLYHAQVFMLDDIGLNAVLVYSRGLVGQRLLEQNIKALVGSRSIIGMVTSSGKPIVIDDTSSPGDFPYVPNPLLPETRAEIALPLSVGSQVIGALDIHSNTPHLFTGEEVRIFQMLANELAIAIHKNRKLAQSEQRVQQSDNLNKRLTRAAWEETEERTGLAEAYHYNLLNVEPSNEDDSSFIEAISAPITIRGEIIGTIAAIAPEGLPFAEGDHAILRAVADRVGSTIEGARLFQETQSNLAITSTLYQLSRHLNEADQLEDVIEGVVVSAASDAVGGEIWLFDDYGPGAAPESVELAAHWWFTPQMGEKAFVIGTFLPLNESTFLSSLEENRVKLVQDITRDQRLDEHLKEAYRKMGCQAIVVIPFNVRGQWRGLLTLYYAQSRTFSETEGRIYTALIEQAGVAIDNRLLLRQTEMTLSQIERLYAASRIINAATDFPELVRAAVAATTTDWDFELGILEGHIDKTGWPTLIHKVARSNKGEVIQLDQIEELKIPADSPLHQRQPEQFAAGAQEMGLKAIFPLFSANVPIALFYIYDDANEELTPEDSGIYKALTGQMSTVLENQRLLQRTASALDETRRLYQASRDITTAQDAKGVYQAAVGHLEQSSERLSRVSILLAGPDPSPDAAYFDIVHIWEKDPDMDHPVSIGMRLTAESAPFGGFTGEEATYIRNLNSNTSGDHRLRLALARSGAVSLVIAPMRSQRNWFGVMICESQEENAFDDQYARYVQAITNQVAVAVENRLLFDEAQMEAQRALALAEVGQLATRVGAEFERNISEVFARVAEPANYDRWMLMLISENNPRELQKATLRFPDIEDTSEFSFDLDKAEHSIADAVRENRSFVVNEPSKYPAFVGADQDILENIGKHLVTPIHVGGSIVGALLVGRSLTAADLDDRDEQLVGTLAAQVAVAIENRRLFRAVEGEREYLRSILETMPTGIMVLDPRTFLPIQVNAQAEQLLGKAINLRLAFSVSDYNLIRTGTNVHYPVEEMPIFVAAATGREAFSDDLAVVHEDGTQTDLLINAAPIFDMRGSMIAIVAGLQNISNLRGLENALQQNLREQISLYETTRALAEAHDIEEALDATIAQLVMMEPMDAYIVLLDERTGDLQPMRGIFSPEQFNLPQEVFQGTMLLSSDINYEPRLDADVIHTLSGMGIQSIAIMPLRARDILMGWIAIIYDRQVEFSADTERFLITLTDNAAVAIDNRNLFRKTEESFEEATIQYETSRALSSATTPDEIVHTVTTKLGQPNLTQVFMALPATTTTVSGALEVVATWTDENSGAIDLMGVTLSPDQFPPWRLAVSTEIVVIDDVTTDGRLDDMERMGLQSTDTRSLTILPLRAGNRSIGVIWMASSLPYQHTDRDLRLYRSFVEQASLSMEATRLLEQTERRARQLATSAEVSQIASSILDLNQLMARVVDVIQEAFGYDHVQIFLMDNTDTYAELRASTGEPGRQLLAINHKLAKGSHSVIGQVTATGEPTLALDTADSAVVHKPNPYLPLTRSEMALPLVIQNRVVGALDVQSNTPNAFSDEDLAVLKLLAAQISVAIDNARLFEQAQVRARDMGFLFNVTTAAAAPELSLNQSMQSAAELVRKTLDALDASIYLTENYTTPEGEVHTLLRAVALAGSDQPLSEIAEIYMGDEGNFLTNIVRYRETQLIEEIESEGSYLPISTDARSAIAAPFVSGNIAIGVIVLEDSRPNFYNRETVDLLNTLTTSLSAIIQSARLLEQVQHNNELLRELDRLKSDFLANMSHELRTPLNSIIGFSRVILKGIDGPLTEMQEQDLSTIYNSGTHLLGLINDILDQAKISSGKMDLHPDFFDMKPVAEGVRSIAIGLIKDKPVDLKLEVASGLPKAYGDEFRTRQVLLNLVSNSSKFTQQGTISIRVYQEQPDPDAPPMIRVDVQDTGIGIAEKDLPLLFEAFRQVDSSLTRTVGGTGLGLPIAKSLIEMQGGKMLVYSELNVGSIFSILIPTQPPVDGENAPAEVEDDTQSRKKTGMLTPPKATFDPPPSTAKQENKAVPSEEPKEDTVETPSANGKSNSPLTMPMMMPTKRQILLIEDNPTMVDQFRRMLQREGFDIFTASFPLEAEAMASGLHPTLIIMSADFHNGASWDMLNRLQSRDDTIDIPVIMVALTDESERSKEAGAFAFIQRPFTPDQLTDAVHRAETESQTDRILIIDDQPESARLLKEALDDSGRYRVFAAQSGHEGISMIARRRPDLVILDLRMPEMDGFAVLGELQANPETASIPVVIVTADTLNHDEQSQISNLEVLYKTDLNQGNYQTFIKTVKTHLTGGNGH